MAQAWANMQDTLHDMGTFPPPNGVCLTCGADPNHQHVTKGRPHPGQRYHHGWIPVADPIVSKPVKIGGHSITITAHADGTRSFHLPDGRTAHLTKDELAQFNGLAYAPSGDKYIKPWEPGQGKTLRRYYENHGPDGEVQSVHVQDMLGVKLLQQAPELPDEETWNQDLVSLHIPSNPDMNADELLAEPGVQMRQRQLTSLIDIAQGMTAERVDTGRGKVDVYRDGGKVVLHPQGGKPWALDRRSASRMWDAWNELADDEYRDPRSPTETASQTVHTNLGDVTISMTGEWDGGSLTGAGLDPIQIAPGFDNSYALWSAFEAAGRLEKAASADVAKGHPYPGQRFTHGWKPVIARELTQDERDLADELRHNGATVHPDGTVDLYHRTTPQAAAEIHRTGRMHGKEDGVFFTTRHDVGQATGYGDSTVHVRMPLGKLQIDDVFGDEAHVRVPLRRAGDSIDVSAHLVHDVPDVAKTHPYPGQRYTHGWVPVAEALHHFASGDVATALHDDGSVHITMHPDGAAEHMHLHAEDLPSLVEGIDEALDHADAGHGHETNVLTTTGEVGITSHPTTGVRLTRGDVSLHLTSAEAEQFGQHLDELAALHQPQILSTHQVSPDLSFHILDGDQVAVTLGTSSVPEPVRWDASETEDLARVLRGERPQLAVADKPRRGLFGRRHEPEAPADREPVRNVRIHPDLGVSWWSDGSASIDTPTTEIQIPAAQIAATATTLQDLANRLGPTLTPKGARLVRKLARTTMFKVDEGEAGRYRARFLIRWFERGGGAARIRWGEGGDFMRCVRLAGEHMEPGKAKGFCANRHHGALGIWPATHAKLDREATGKKAAGIWTGTVSKAVYAELTKVGPKGYVHGWIKVGPGSVGDMVQHPEFGSGVVTQVRRRTTTVHFLGDTQHSFEHIPQAGRVEHFVPRTATPRPAGGIQSTTGGHIPVQPVRPELSQAATTQEVGAVLADQIQKISGRKVEVDFSGSDVGVARQHAEGILRGVQRFPKADLGYVGSYGPGSAAGPVARTMEAEHGTAYAVTYGPSAIYFNNVFAGNPTFYHYHVGAGDPREIVATTLQEVALHEFGHVVDRNGTHEEAARQIVRDRAAQVGAAVPSEFLRRAISTNATRPNELVAEVFVAVMADRYGVGPMESQIFALLEQGK